MSTRGIYGFQIDGELKITCSPHDSYPEGTGQVLLDAVRDLRMECGDDGLAATIRALRCVPPDFRIQDSDIRRANSLLPPGQLRADRLPIGGAATIQDLFPAFSGRIKDAINFGIVPDCLSFAADGLFCEWGYVVDLDAMIFEVYVGFLEERHSRGRFAALDRAQDQYAPIAGLVAWPIDSIPEDWDHIAHVADTILTSQAFADLDDVSAHEKLIARRLIREFPEHIARTHI